MKLKFEMSKIVMSSQARARRLQNRCRQTKASLRQRGLSISVVIVAELLELFDSLNDLLLKPGHFFFSSVCFCFTPVLVTAMSATPYT